MDTDRNCRTSLNLSKRPLVNIEFQDLTYSVSLPRSDPKIILRNINGKFKSGQLTAILGVSGAGKSTLLNILAGYKCVEATGLVSINGEPRNMKNFLTVSRYIMQEQLAQPFLTVQECMSFAADFKLGHKFPKEKKHAAIFEILDMLGLLASKDTLTNSLSGGEKKRLSIALEMINNPSVIFLDEPTTGLDDVASWQCISLLKRLAKGGRTVVCSIHTPSARLLEMFDHLYILADGLCVYQGKPECIIPFLRDLDLECPTHYNPVDFFIDVSCGEYGPHLNSLVNMTQNGKNRYPSLEFAENIDDIEMNSLQCSEVASTEVEDGQAFNSSTWEQFKIHIRRTSLQTFRKKDCLAVRTAMNLFLCLVIGTNFYKCGNDASITYSNLGFLFLTTINFSYCALLPPLLHFPLEVPHLKREYFNKWYNLQSYFWAKTLTGIPGPLYLCVIYMIIVYTLTDQPLEIKRIVEFATICMLVSMISEAMGMAVASAMDVVHGFFMGSALMAPLLILGGYGQGLNDTDIPIILRLSQQVSFVRYGLEGLMASVYGDNRAKLPCPEEKIFCMFTSPKDLMEYHSLGKSDFWFSVYLLSALYVFTKCIHYYLLRQRLLPNKFYRTFKMFLRFIRKHVNQST